MKKNLRFKKNKIVVIYSAILNTFGTMFSMLLLEIPLVLITIGYIEHFQKAMPSASKDNILIAVLALIPVAGILRLIRSYFIYKGEFYEIRKDRIIAEAGILFEVLMDIDIKNIVTICYDQSLLEVLTGSATILINTNATQNDCIVLKHVNEYKRVYEHINRLRNN